MLTDLSNQVDYVLQHLSPNRPTLVTITISMDDYGWQDPKLVFALILSSPKTFDNYLAHIGKLVEPRLGNQVDRLLKNQNVVVIFTDYANPINKDSIFFHALTPGCPSLLCYPRAEKFVHYINKSLTDKVVPFLSNKYHNRVGIALIHDEFHENHESPGDASRSGTKPPWKTCGFAEPPGLGDTWIQYPGEKGVNGRVPGWLSRGTGEKYGDCFHPNYLGADAIGEAVNAAALTLGR